MTTARVALQSEIAGTERAIRLLIGEDAAVRSKLARSRALLKLERTRLAALVASKPLPVASRFPDVSNNNANVNVAQVRGASSVRVGDLMFTKLTEGASFVDQIGIARLRAMATAEFPSRGVYAFLHPSISGQIQAQYLLQTLDTAKITLGPADIVAGDLEVSDGKAPAAVARCALDFATEIAKHLASKRWLYGGGPFLHQNGVTLAGYDAHWLAAYVGNPAPFMVFGSSRTVAWQFTDGRYGPQPHVCPGIGACDLSIVL